MISDAGSKNTALASSPKAIREIDSTESPFFFLLYLRLVMAQIVMLENHNGKKKGELVQIPFLEGRGLVQIGVAVYWDGKPIPQPSPMQLQAVPPVELKTESPVPEFNADRIGEEPSDAELERLTAPKSKSKKHKQ